MTTFRLFAGTDIGLRDNNEDNFTVCPDLMKGEWIIPDNQQAVIELGERGCLVVVTDGMGGQQAGEVASAIAIATVQQWFSPAVLPQSATASAEKAAEYMKKVIRQADLQIKKRSSSDTTARGMGSTIVMAWLLGGTAIVAWLGDSRAYSFVPSKGITRLSKDHSYVQRLVDEGHLTEEQAMLDENSNIVTRSLGDASQKARPEVAIHQVASNELILLCSDGLCGVCTDKQISGILQQNLHSLPVCKEVLTEAALNAGGSDNITIALLQVAEASSEAPTAKEDSNVSQKNWVATMLLACFALFIALSLGYAGYHLIVGKNGSSATEAAEEVNAAAATKSSPPKPAGTASETKKPQQDATGTPTAEKQLDLQKLPPVGKSAAQTNTTIEKKNETTDADSITPSPANGMNTLDPIPTNN